MDTGDGSAAHSLEPFAYEPAESNRRVFGKSVVSPRLRAPSSYQLRDEFLGLDLAVRYAVEFRGARVPATRPSRRGFLASSRRSMTAPRRTMGVGQAGDGLPDRPRVATSSGRGLGLGRSPERAGGRPSRRRRQRLRPRSATVERRPDRGISNTIRGTAAGVPSSPHRAAGAIATP